MPYRDPARRPTEPGPEIDLRVLGVPWWSPLLVLTVLGGPVAIALTWLGDLTVKCGGPSRPATFSEKVATTAVIGAWMVLLLVLRARQRRREIQTLAALAENDRPAEGMRVSDVPEEVPATRVATDESDAALPLDDDASREPARRVRKR